MKNKSRYTYDDSEIENIAKKYIKERDDRIREQKILKLEEEIYLDSIDEPIKSDSSPLPFAIILLGLSWIIILIIVLIIKLVNINI